MKSQQYPYTIQNIHTNDRFPGQIYAEVHDENGKLICAATLSYCCDRIKEMIKEEGKVNLWTR